MRAPAVDLTRKSKPPSAVLYAAWHGLGWLLIANLIGNWLAFQLIVPSSSSWLGEWTYGRWMPVHLNFQLYGWLSFPLIAWLLKVYGVDHGEAANWSRTALWAWSLALTVAAFSWLSGHGSGKLFLDWAGYNRVLFPASVAFLWGVLSLGYLRRLRAWTESKAARIGKIAGLTLLALVPFAIYAAANPAIYPAVNPDSGGPTGSSQLESVLVIVLILFLVPYGLHERMKKRTRAIQVSWSVFLLQVGLCLWLGNGDFSHHRPAQFLSLGSLLVWIILMPLYYSDFRWEPVSRRWLGALLFWWVLLIPTGWCLFLPGILDRLKFTDGLVSHSLMAMAGFATSLLIVLMTVLLGRDGNIFSARWSFYLWNGGTLVYVILLIYAGWVEGANPAFTIVPGRVRETLYFLRLLCGLAMTAASADWFFRLHRRLFPTALLAPSTAAALQRAPAGGFVAQ